MIISARFLFCITKLPVAVTILKIRSMILSWVRIISCWSVILYFRKYILSVYMKFYINWKMKFIWIISQGRRMTSFISLNSICNLFRKCNRNWIAWLSILSISFKATKKVYRPPCFQLLRLKRVQLWLTSVLFLKRLKAI